MIANRRLSIVANADPALLVVVTGAVREFARGAGFTDRDCQRLEVATDEICTNVVTHAYGHDLSRTYRVEVEIVGPCLEIRVFDRGEGFRVEEVPAPDPAQGIEEVRIGGLGICLCRKMMDDVSSHRTAEGENCVRLVKRLPVDVAASADG